MAQRTVGALLCITPLRQAKKEQAIPARAGDLASNSAQRAVAARIVLKSVAEHLDNDLPIAEAPREQRSRFRQPVILWRSRAINGRTEIRSCHEFLRCSNPEIPIIGDVAYSAAPPFAQCSFG